MSEPGSTAPTPRTRTDSNEQEFLQSALSTVHGGLDAVETIAETADEVRRGARCILKLGLAVAIVGVVVAIVLRARRSSEPARSSTEVSSD